MSRTKRARSPAAEYEVELHSPTRRRIRYNKPRVHARPLACAQDLSDDEQELSSSDDEDELSIDVHGLEIVFEEPDTRGTQQLQETSNSAPSSAPSPALAHTHTPPSPRTPSPTPWTSAYPLPLARSPSAAKPETRADALRRIASEGRAILGDAGASLNTNRQVVYQQVSARDDPYIQNTAHLRQILDGDRRGIYIDSGNHNHIRVVDCAQDDSDTEDPTSPSPPPATVLRRVRVQPPPGQR